jgi:hypothetical protein
MKQFNVTELDFDKIKDAIKAYYKRTDSTFKDFDYEGSGLNLILDILAYNTHYNAILAHLAANEGFIASAQLRKNVVARAKTLGYIPHSVSAARTTLTLTNVDSSILSIPAGTTFTTTDTLSGTTYSFVNISEIGTPTDPFEIFQGTLKTREFVFDSQAQNLKFEIPDTSIDITKLSVTTFPNTNSTQQETYTKFSELAGLDGDSLVYFISENPNGKYEISFGDNIIGKKPDAGSIVKIQYLVTDGLDANGLSTFTTTDSLFDSVSSKPIISVSAATSGGGDKETIESIRANAPLNYLSQNRAVTPDDYVSLVRNNINAAAVSVWGGEDNTDPEYGSVFISVKPTNGETLTDLEKASLLPILNKKGILTVRPKIIDPEYVYLYFDIFTKFNSTLTDAGEAGISSLVRNGLSAYNSAYLSDFDGVFRNSQLLTYLVNLDTSILSATLRLKAYKKFTATTTNTGQYKIDFNFALEAPGDTTSSLISSSEFKINNTNYYFADEPSTVNDIRNIYRYFVDSNTNINIMEKRNIGTINTRTGLITIEDFDIDADTEISIFVKPASDDIAPSRNEIIDIDSGIHTTISSEVDTIATAGSTGAIGYTTIARDTY